jgi:tRNA-dihydrouridine synthase B
MNSKDPAFVISTARISPPTVMAPMAGITDAPFRRMVKQNHCGLVCSEMISASGLYQNSGKTVQMMDHGVAEKPISVQIFGAKPHLMAYAASMAEQAGADILDINFGCSVKKVVKTGAGAALMKDVKAARTVIAAVRSAVTIPLTIKIRSGWDPSGREALALAQSAQDLGVDAVCVHPRTAPQGFSGSADWSVISGIKQRLSIPVIGNGDIRSAADALEMMAQTGCDGVMIGRAAMANPWIFEQIRAMLAGRPAAEADLGMRFAAMRTYAAQMCACYGEAHACRLMRSRLGWLLKGLARASAFRQAVTRVSTMDEVSGLLADYELLLSGDLRSTDSTNPTIKSA